MNLVVLTFGNLFKKMEPRYILRLFLLIAPRDLWLVRLKDFKFPLTTVMEKQSRRVGGSFF